MKIIAVSEYAENGQLVFFHRPDNTLLRNGKAFYLPKSPILGTLYLATKINRIGRSIPIAFATRYFDTLSLGCVFQDRHRYEYLKSQNLPCDGAMSFDGSTPIGDFIKTDKLLHDNKVDIKLSISFQHIASSVIEKPLSIAAQKVSDLSYEMTLKIGDIILIPIFEKLNNTFLLKNSGQLEGEINGVSVLYCNVK